jgi:endonuclease YncB( thermonuclease family)
MTKHVIYGTFGLVAAAIIAAAIYFDKPTDPTPAAALEQKIASGEQGAAVASASSDTSYNVSKVIDGDTVVVTMAGEQETVRLVGIDAPETGTHGECFATEATQELKSLIGGGGVTLEKDPSQGERDKDDRLLAYVFTEACTNVAEELIRGGFAKEIYLQQGLYVSKKVQGCTKKRTRCKKGFVGAECVR